MILIQCFDKIIERNRNFATAYSYKGDALFNLERYNESIQYYEKAIKLDSNILDALNKRGSALFHLKKYNEASLFFQKAVHLNPNDFSSNYYLNISIQRGCNKNV